MKKTVSIRGGVGGAVGGVLMAMWSMIAMWFSGEGFWTPVNLIAHTAYPSAPIDATFSWAALVIGALVHFAMSVAFGVVFAALMTPWAGWAPTITTSALSGMAYGIVVWLVMQFLIWPFADTVASSAFTPWIFGVGHLIYGLSVGLAVGRVRPTVGSAPTRPNAA